ncbi:unnamed protein product [Durusdinium trenchii]|uniref:Uncharacterized protein n=2 Tax=Durusdinium trenchii TaxID=1381693 RepID=A0ABP0SR64_9DINO
MSLLRPFRCRFQREAIPLKWALSRWAGAKSEGLSEGDGVVVGFERQGWPLVRLIAPEAQEAPEPPVVVADPGSGSHGLLMRGQMLRLSFTSTGWKLLHVVDAGSSGRKRQRCIHPTRVGGLCKSCPRRSKSKSR